MKKRMLSLAASTLLVSSAMAAANIATDGTGDMLVAPMYTYAYDYNTKIVLMNTDNEHAYLVRVGLFDQNASKEVFDVALMMSPGDSWDALIKDGRIISNDDSNWAGPIDHVISYATDSNIDPSTGYIVVNVLYELNNTNPLVANALHRSNYSSSYKMTTTDVASIDKSTLKFLFKQALNGDSTLVVDKSQINQDAIGGYVTISSVTNGTLHTTLPLFAFEHTREGATAITEGAGFKFGEPYHAENFVNPTEVLNLIKYRYVSIPYQLENSDAKLNLTFILDHLHDDSRTYKQNFRNMSEKFPEETGQCLQGDDLVNYIESNKDKFPDAKDHSLSPYREPTCELQFHQPALSLKNEVDGIIVSQALEREQMKTFDRIIKYWGVDNTYHTVVDTLPWNDVTPADYKSGMYQVHDIKNVIPDQRAGDTPGYIPTYFDIQIIDGVPFLNWNYAIRNK